MPFVVNRQVRSLTTDQPLSAPSTEPQAQERDSKEQVIWIVVSVMISTFIVASIAAIWIIRRRRKQSGEFMDARRRDPNLSRKEFARVRKLSNVELTQEQESQRINIIRKSLAIRSSMAESNSTFSISNRTSYVAAVHENHHYTSSSIDRYSNIPGDCNSDGEAEEEEDIDFNEGQPTQNHKDGDSFSPIPQLGDRRSVTSLPEPRRNTLRDDWKEFEARVSKERLSSGEVHPCVVASMATFPRTAGRSSTCNSPYYSSYYPSPYLMSPSFSTPYLLQQFQSQPGLSPSTEVRPAPMRIHGESPSASHRIQELHPVYALRKDDKMI